MTETKPKLEFTVAENRGRIPVIVVAAGSSTRMQGVNKQLTLLSGVPVIIRSLLAFEQHPDISNIILVVRAEDIFELQMLATKYNISKLSDIVCGGNTRQESVAKGLARVDKACEKVLIHDGARPLVTKSIIDGVIKGLEDYKAVTCGVKVKDTVKITDENGVVINTVPRENLVAVHTPQGVWVEAYKNAIEKLGDISAFTDDTSIMEAAGHKVLISESSYKNLKITTPEDILVAEAYLKGDAL